MFLWSIRTTHIACGAAAIAAIAGPAYAALLFSASSPSSFGSTEFQDMSGNYGSSNGSSISNVSDPTYGTVLRFRKVAADRRAEVKGADGVTIADGQTYFVGFRFKVNNLNNLNSIFQWKSYGNHQQNFPFIIKITDGRIRFEHYKIGVEKVLLFDAPMSANTWYQVAFKIKASSSVTGGKIQVYWRGGGAENLKTGGTEYTGRTFDDINVPKWGVYGENGATDLYLDDVKIGTTLNDVYLG